MGKAFQVAVAIGMLGLLSGLGYYQASAAGRLRARAQVAGLASTELIVREMG